MSSNASRKKFSVITVCYNSASTIRETIESVLGQDYPNIEYILIDGKSTDNTWEIIQEYSGKIAYAMSEKDSGLYDAMNKALEKCTGDYIAILNSDDVYHANNVLSTIAAAFEDSKSEIILSDIQIFREERNNIIRKYSAKTWRKWMFRIAWQPPHPGFFACKSVYQKVGIFDTKFKISADFDFMFRAIYLNKIAYTKIQIVSVDMRYGGESQRSWKNIQLANREDSKSMKDKGFFAPVWFMYLKYPIKVFQFIWK